MTASLGGDCQGFGSQRGVESRTGRGNDPWIFNRDSEHGPPTRPQERAGVAVTLSGIRVSLGQQGCRRRTCPRSALAPLPSQDAVDQNEAMIGDEDRLNANVDYGTVSGYFVRIDVELLKEALHPATGDAVSGWLSLSADEAETFAALLSDMAQRVREAERERATRNDSRVQDGSSR
jgi:hypothetical protein